MEKNRISAAIGSFAALMCLLVFYSVGKHPFSAFGIGVAMQFGAFCFFLVRSIHLFESLFESGSATSMERILLLDPRRHSWFFVPAALMGTGFLLAGSDAFRGFGMGIGIPFLYITLDFLVSRKRIRDIRRQA